MRTVSDLMSLADRRALVTGAAGHVGFTVSEVLTELGAAVAMSDRAAAACEANRQRLTRRRRTGRIVAIPCDLSDEEATRRLVRQTIDTLGGLDILIHCAAYVGTTQMDGWVVPFERQTVKAWDAALRVNLTAAFVMVQEARQALAAHNRGSVIFFASTYGAVGPDLRLYRNTHMGNPAGYGTSKGGLLQLTRYLATVLAPRIRVNAITPGGIWRKQPCSFHARYRAKTPLGRMATEEDLKGAIAYLASDLSAYVTGHNLVVDGGWTIW